MYGKDAEKSEEIGDDIRLKTESEDDKITREEAIRRKLNRARMEFDNCTIPSSRQEDVISGKITLTKPIICQDVLAQHGALPEERLEECKDVCEKYNKPGKTSIECAQCLCGSFINYFCCH